MIKALIAANKSERDKFKIPRIVQQSIPQQNIDETRAYFRRVDANLSKSFGRLDSRARPISNHDRLRILHDFFRPSEEHQRRDWAWPAADRRLPGALFQHHSQGYRAV